jgi:hypothetical protein
MKSTISGATLRARMTRRECFLLAALALLTVPLALASPAYDPAPPTWRERDFRVHFHAQQLFGLNAEELSEPELNDVMRWCRCIELTADYGKHGVETLSDNDCRFVMEVLDDLCPRLTEHSGYLLIYQSCATRLAGDDLSPAIASSEEASRHKASAIE